MKQTYTNVIDGLQFLFANHARAVAVDKSDPAVKKTTYELQDGSRWVESDSLVVGSGEEYRLEPQVD